jgi:transcriptional regulator with XRE-family HTH domain
MRRIQYERIAQRLSQRALACLAGLHQPAVSLIEAGRLSPTAEELAALGRALRVDPPSALLKEIIVSDGEVVAR